MIIVALLILGLCVGSFINALVWRLHAQSKKKKPSKKLSIMTGRSMCPDCKHQLASRDLVPVISWLSLKGKCRYCQKPISRQYPLVELLTALIFSSLYILWPVTVGNKEILEFGLWLVFIGGFIALSVYDFKWMLLPDRIVYPLLGLGIAQALLRAFVWGEGAGAIENAVWGVAIGGGIFYLIFQVSKGKWIGGGDVKLGFLLGLLVGGPGQALLMLFMASLIGTLTVLPLLASRRVNRNTRIPFGPFLMLATVIVRLYGPRLIDWYTTNFLFV